jgi:thymidylate synthase
MQSLSWEAQYQNILRDITENGSWKETRQKSKVTGEFLKTRGVTGAIVTIHPEEGIPLLTLRPMGTALRMFVGELMWILSGSAEIADLQKYGVRYWDEWATPEMTKRSNLPDGNLGRIYGPQWRGFFGVEGKPFDQIKSLVWKLRNQPFDKRMVVWAYHPADSHVVMPDGSYVSAMPVRTCHGNFSLHWDGNGTIDMCHTQLSADVPLGIPSNLVMYRVLLEVLCKLTGHKPGKITYMMNDAHFYSDQEEGVAELLTRTPQPAPKITLSNAVVEAFRQIIDDGITDPLASKELNPDGLAYLDWLKAEVTLDDYTPHPVISSKKLPVAV